MLKIKTSKTVSSDTQGLLTEAIRNKAQELYEKRGRKPGHDLENWLEAERIIKSQIRK